MQIQKVVSDIGIGLIGGYIGTRIMEPVSMKLYEREPEEARRQEDAVRPGTPYQIAARKAPQMMGVELTNDELEKTGLVFHYVSCLV